MREQRSRFRDVIVGVDGHEGGRDAIALARLLVTPTGRLALVHVRESGLFPPTAEDEALEAEIDAPPYADSQRLLERERKATGVEAELIDVVDRTVGRGLHQLAERQRAELLVVGSHDRARFGRVLLRDDTRASLDGATCAVAIAPLGYARSAGGLTRIGVGYDGSTESEDALALASELATEHRATVCALRVIPVPSPLSTRYGGTSWEDVLEKDLKAHQEEMAALEAVKGEAKFGFADEELVALSGQMDLLVVGSRGYGPLDRLMLGSTCRHLATHAHCPLIVLPRTATRSDSASDRAKAPKRLDHDGEGRTGESPSSRGDAPPRPSRSPRPRRGAPPRTG
ncbi:MAG: universal stress protein [Solirubrobacteraceae bacterium]